MSLKNIFESIVSEGWNPETGSVSDFTPIPDGDYTGAIKELKYASHDNGESISIIIESDNDGKTITPRHMMYVSNTLEKDWEINGAKKLIKVMAKLAHLVGIELDEDSFEDLESLVDEMADVIGEDLTISLTTRYNKKKKKDEQQSDVLFPEVEYEFVGEEEDEEEDDEDVDSSQFSRDEDDEEEEEEDDEDEAEKLAEEKAKKAKKAKAAKAKKAKAEKEAAEKAKKEAEEAEEDEDEEGDEEEGDYSKEELNDMKLSELRDIAETEYGIETEGLKKKQLIDSILAEA